VLCIDGRVPVCIVYSTTNFVYIRAADVEPLSHAYISRQRTLVSYLLYIFADRQYDIVQLVYSEIVRIDSVFWEGEGRKEEIHQDRNPLSDSGASFKQLSFGCWRSLFTVQLQQVE